MSRDYDRGRGGYSREDSRERERGRDSGPPGKVSLLVRNLTFRTRPEDVKRIFSDFGDVRDVYLPLDFGTQKPRGFAFVEYYDPGDAAHSKDRLDGYNLDGRNISVLYAQEKRKRPDEMVQKERVEPRSRRSRSRSRSRSRGYGGYAARRSRSPPRRRYSRSSSRSPRRGSPRRRDRSYSRGHDNRRSYSRDRSRSRSRGGGGSGGKGRSRSPSPRRDRDRSVSPRDKRRDSDEDDGHSNGRGDRRDDDRNDRGDRDDAEDDAGR